MAPLVMCCFKRLTVANVNLSDQSESRAFRLLFDSGAQLSYASPKVKVFLNPEIKAKKRVVLKTFGENTSTKILEVVQLVVASKTAEDDIKLQAFVTDICHPLKNQNSKFAKKNFSHIRNLTLGDENCLKSSDIDILIGSDYYWHFMKNRIIRQNADERVALETKLGYVLSGKLDIGINGRHQINLNESLVTNVLRVQQELTDAKEQLKYQSIIRRPINKLYKPEGLVSKVTVQLKFIDENETKNVTSAK